MSSENVLICEKLRKAYESFVALECLDLAIPAGSVFGYIGHNGAGKTTTIRMLAGLLLPTSGRASICGYDIVEDRNKIKSLLGYMPDNFGVYDQMRVWEYLDFFGAAYKIPRKERRKRVEYVLEVTEGAYMRDKFVDTLSKGMKQRVGIARTLMHDPKVILLDEPANGLDPRARVQMRELIRRLADNGKTILVSSHILPELAAICNFIAILHRGRLLASGTIDEVLQNLQRDRLMEVKLKSDLAIARNILDNDPKATEVQVSEIDAATLQFRYSGDDDNLADLLAAINTAGARAVTFREVPLSLEDAYMTISAMGLEGDEAAGDAVPTQKENDGPAAAPEGECSGCCECDEHADDSQECGGCECCDCGDENKSAEVSGNE